ncbi:putative hemolysin [Rhodobacter sp. NSM]|uniref:putative hemolysin n=1 Tax=Rhodobacter sp. NSM TaxID=3457501 RepID=UPI003FD0CC19
MNIPKLPILLLLALPACGGGDPDPAPSAGGTDLHRPGMANPASVYCGRQGGRLEIRTEGTGRSGYCHLPDGRTLEEWELYRDAEPL